MKPKVIVIIGRKWFDKKAGNTYHDAEIVVHGTGKTVLQGRTHMDYGYGEGYVQSASAWLEDQGVLKLERYSNGAVQPLWQYCSDKGIKLIRTEVNVASRKELKGG
jgi:hypothetical protein